MRWQTTAILAALLIALGIAYYVYEVRLGPEREKTEGRKGRVFSAETTEVTEMTLKRGDETVRLKREAEEWQMLEPLKARGERGPIEETLANVVTAKMDREIAAEPKDLAEFGLAKPAAEVTLGLKDGKQLGLLLGAKNPTGVWVYAQERGKPAVFVLGDSVLRDATRPVADFRNKTVLSFDRKDVTGLVVVTRDETLAVEASGEGGWRLTRPRPLPADPETVDELLNKLTAAKIKEFVADGPKSLQPYGLERPVRLTIQTGKDKDRATKELLLGSVDDKKKGIYAQRPGENSVLLLPEDVWTALPKTTAALRNKSLLAFDQAKVTRVELESPRGTVTAVRDPDNKWRLTSPEAVPADAVEVGGLLMRLKGLRALGFLSDDAVGIGRYLARPEVRATLTIEGQSAPLTVLLAPSPDKRIGATSAYAGVAGQGPVVLVDGAALTEIGRSPNELRDRTLLGGLELKDVKRVALKSGGKSLLLERKDEIDWRILEGGSGTAKSGKVEDMLYALRLLRWKDIAAPKADAPAQYGLQAPEAEMSLYRADGTEIATVQVGKQDGDRRYVKLKSAPAVYAIDARQLQLPKVPEDFQG
jgi:hypothetical protein